MTQTGHRIKWDHFDILATRQSDIHCKIKETLLIRDLKPALNENIGSEKLLLYYTLLSLFIFICFWIVITHLICYNAYEPLYHVLQIW